MRTAGFGDSAWTPTSGVLPMRSRIDSYRAKGAALYLSAGDRGEDRDHVAVGQLGVELVEVPDVVVVAGLVDELLGHARVAARELGEHLAHRAFVGGHRRRAPGERT